jgi:cytochrome c2
MRTLRRRSCIGALALCVALPLSALDLHRERSAPTDLALTGKLAGLPAAETHYVRWADLRALPTTKLTLTDAFLPGKQEVTALFLSDLWHALPRTRDTDVILTTCKDGYASVFRQDFIATYRPFLVLEINGIGPDQWPPPGRRHDPGPYIVHVATELVPAVGSLLDINPKRPWGVNTLEIATFTERFRDAFTGKGAALTPRAAAGREIWINACASCHRGAGTMFGGTKSDRPFEVLAAHASYNAAYFKKYVRAPTSVLPGATMQSHPHYTDAQLDELIAFITAASALAAQPTEPDE